MQCDACCVQFINEITWRAASFRFAFMDVLDVASLDIESVSFESGKYKATLCILTICLQITEYELTNESMMLWWLSMYIYTYVNSHNYSYNFMYIWMLSVLIRTVERKLAGSHHPQGCVITSSYCKMCK